MKFRPSHSGKLSQHMLRLFSAGVALGTLGTAAWAQAPAAPAKGPSLIANGNLQTDENGDGVPDKWPPAKGKVSYQLDGENRYLRLEAEPNKMVLSYTLIPIPDGIKALELSWKQRITDLKPGSQPWFDARILMEFKDAAGKKMRGAPSAPYARKSTDGWVEKTTAFLVPEGAKVLEFMPALFQVKSGVFELDDFVLTATDPAPLEEKARERAAATAERRAKEAEKRQERVAAQLTANGGSLLANGNFQTDENGDGVPDKWPAAKGPISYEKEGDNRFLRMVSQEPGKMVMMFRTIDLPADAKAMQLSWKQRITNLKPGAQPWFDARIMMDFKDASGKKLSGGPSAPNARKDTDGWVEKSKSFLVPAGAVTLDFMPTLFNVVRGTFDLDDLSLTIVDAAPILAEQAKAAEEFKRINLPYEEPNKAKWPKPIRVVGKNIIDSDGKDVWLQGVNIMSLDWSIGGERVLLSTKVAIEDWKANIIRLAVKDKYWFGQDPLQKDGGKAYRELVDAAINYAANRGAYVLLDLHHYLAPKAEYATFWTDAATRYKDHPALIFDLMNEPHGTTWDVWKNGGFVAQKRDGVDEAAFLTEEEKIKNKLGFRSIGMQALLDAVRATGAKNVVLAGGLDYGYDLSGITKGYELDDRGGNGIIYGSHTYPWKSKWQAKFLDAAAKHPVLIGECGGNYTKMSFIPASQQEDVETWVPAFLGLVQQYKLHWTGFSFHPKASPVMISDWNYTPTPEWGALAKRALAGEKFPPPDRLR